MFELAQLPHRIGGHTVTLAGFDRGLINPAAQRFL